jgi:hypothetical protein
MAAHAFDAFGIVDFLGGPVDGLHRAAVHAGIALSAFFKDDPRSRLQEIHDLDNRLVIARFYG